MQVLKRTLAALATLCLASFAALAAPFAYVPSVADGVVVVVDLATGTVVATITVGNSPAGIALSPSNDRVFVGNIGSTSISVIDANRNAVVASVNLPAAPFGLAMNAAGTRLAVATPGNGATPGATIAMVNPATNTVIGTATVGSGPTGMLFNPSGSRLYTANLAGNSISVLDPATLAVLATIPVAAGPFELAIDASGSRLYVSHLGDTVANIDGHTVTVINTASNTVLTTITVGTNPAGLAINPAGTRLYVANTASNSVSVINTATNSVLSTFTVGTAPNSVAVSADGSSIYVVNGDDATLGIYDAATFRRVGLAPLHAGSLAIGSFVGSAAPGPSANLPGARSGIWWNPNESGWGINFTQRGSNIFVAWYTYDAGGNPKWYVASNCTFSGASCSGALFQVTGPRFFGATFNPSAETVTVVGTITVNFTNNDSGSMTYVVNGQSRFVPIQRQVFGDSVAPAVNYTDLWWNPSESGWGMAITHRGSALFAAWYVYDNTGQPVWYVAPNCSTLAAGNRCTSDVFRTTGPAFGPTFNASQVQSFNVGTLTLNFPDANNGTATYTVNGVSGSKTITRQIF